MKKIVFIASLIFSISIAGNAFAQCSDELIEVCYPLLGDFKYIKSYPIKFKKSKKGTPPLSGKNVLVLNGGTKYKIVACNAEEMEGKLIMQLFQSSSSTLVGSTYDPTTKKHYNGIEFSCKMSGVYYLSYYFDEGKEGCSVILLSEQKGR